MIWNKWFNGTRSGGLYDGCIKFPSQAFSVFVESSKMCGLIL